MKKLIIRNVGQGPFAICEHRRSTDERAHPCNLIWIYITIAIDSVSGQRKPRSACANAQADQGLRCPQIAQVPFSCVTRHIKKK